VDEPLTLSGLVAEVARRIAALPAPRNGQVRAVPDAPPPVRVALSQSSARSRIGTVGEVDAAARVG